MRSLLKLWPYLRVYKLQIFIVFITGLVLSACARELAQLAQMMMNAFANKEAEKIMVVPFYFIALYLVNGTARYIHLFTLKFTVDKVVVQIRKDLQAKLLRLNLNFHYNFRSGGGGLLSQTLNDVNIIIWGLFILADVVREPITVLFLVGYMFHLDWQLTLASLIFLPVLFGVLSVVTKGLRRHSHVQMEHMEHLSGTIKETLDGIRVIQSFNLEEEMRKRLDAVSDRYLKTRKSIYKREESAGPITELVASIALSAIAYYIGRKILNGTGTIGDFVGFLTAAFSLQPSIKKLQDGYVRLQQTSVAIDRIQATLDDPNEVPLAANMKPFPKDWQTIEFKNVSFQYGDKAVLKNLNIQIRRGQVLALVGESGSGKSTIINILMRFFDATSGQITIDQTPIEDIDLKDLRQNIAMVSQDVFLFNDSVAYNIRSGNMSQNKEVASVSKSANAHNFIERLDDKYETRVGDRGNLFSGGEKQRISIARAFYKDAPILILDEATSALDSISEIEVQKGLDHLMEGRTAIVIAHRLSTITNADVILVLKDGKIVEQGSHKDLLLLEGEYKKYFLLQNTNS